MRPGLLPEDPDATPAVGEPAVGLGGREVPEPARPCTMPVRIETNVSACKKME